MRSGLRRVYRALAAREMKRARLEQDDVGASSEAWPNPPRDAAVPDAPCTRIVVLARTESAIQAGPALEGRAGDGARTAGSAA